MTDPRLITIPLSHYCEKARWALDVTAFAYREEGHAPVAHLRATRAAGGKTVPLLVHEGRVFADSTDIAHHADALAPPDRRLVPAAGDPARARVLALEDELDETLGVDARLLAYWYNLKDPEPARAMVSRMMPVRSPPLTRIAATLFRRLIFRKYRVSQATAELAERRVRSMFSRLGETLETDGYLVAGRFTLADLTLAALASPLLTPPEHPLRRVKTATPPGLAALRDELSATPTGRHVLRMYREHRAPVPREAR